MPSSSIKSASVVVALTWTYGAYVVGFVAQLAGLIVLSRLLRPLDFGIFAACTLVTEGLSRCTAPKLGLALLQQRAHTDTQLNTVWTAELLRGLLLGAAIFVAAPALSAALGIPQLTSPLRLLALLPVADGAVNPAVVGFLRRLDMRRQFLISAPRDVGRYLVAITIALWHPSVWALVVGYLVGVWSQVVASYLVAPFRPRLHIDVSELRSLYRFGGWLHLQEVLTWMQRRLDTAIVGRLLGGVELGYYNRAFALAGQPQQLNDAIRQVTFPTFAAMRSEPERVSLTFRHAFNLALLTTVPVMLAAFAFPSELITLLLGARWTPLAPLVQVLTVAVAMRIVLDTTLPLFRGLGVPRIEFTVTAVNSLVISALLYPCVSRWGAPGAAVAILGGALAACPVAIHYLKEVARIRTVELIPNLLGAAFALVAAWVAVALGRSLSLPPILLLAVAAVTYAGVLLLLEPLMEIGTFRTLRAAAAAYRQR